MVNHTNTIGRREQKWHFFPGSSFSDLWSNFESSYFSCDVRRAYCWSLKGMRLCPMNKYFFLSTCLLIECKYNLSLYWIITKGCPHICDCYPTIVFHWFLIIFLSKDAVLDLLLEYCVQIELQGGIMYSTYVVVMWHFL